jgi:glycosyltransferase involved in cell wall biosynthesis
MIEVAFITVSKGRLHHIRQTLPLIVAQRPAEIIVVDYGCPQQTGAWVAESHPTARVVRVDDDAGFCLARARNIGARHCRSPWLFFIDADVEVKPGLVEWASQKASPTHYYVVAGQPKELAGTVLVHRQAFKSVFGYDEVFRGWGGEDFDLYHRLTSAGFCRSNLPALLAPVLHEDAERVAFYPVRDIQLQLLINCFYLAAKQQIAATAGGRGQEPPRAALQSVMDTIVKEFTVWDQAGRGPLPSITFNIAGKGWLPPPFVLEKQTSFTLRLTRPLA